jgi:hypothetical protein
MVFSHHRIRPRGGLGDAHLGGGAIAVGLGGQRISVDRLRSGGDRLADQVLHGDWCVGCLVGPAPVSTGRRVGDGGQLAQGMRATQLVVTSR